jgi:hypothetical protein
MLKGDFVIQSEIRRILARSLIDSSKISFGAVKGVVYLKGVFEMAHSYTDGSAEAIQEFTKKNLKSLEKKIRDIPGVSDINFQIVNWKKEKGQWIPKSE